MRHRCRLAKKHVPQPLKILLKQGRIVVPYPFERGRQVSASQFGLERFHENS